MKSNAHVQDCRYNVISLYFNLSFVLSKQHSTWILVFNLLPHSSLCNTSDIFLSSDLQYKANHSEKSSQGVLMITKGLVLV